MLNVPKQNGYYWLKTYREHLVTKETQVSQIEIVSVFFNVPYRKRTRNLVCGRFQTARWRDPRSAG